ncbi:MAG: hypothetical protein Q7R76_01240 [Candidatus Woesearchaeota archaeon]|nr:hypothetical protein [Candidatus Woesearchaeota archaeon]
MRSLEDTVLKVMGTIMPIASGLATGIFAGGLGKFAIPTFARMTFNEARRDVKDLRTGAHPLPLVWLLPAAIVGGAEGIETVSRYWTRGRNIAHNVAYYAASGYIVSQSTYHSVLNTVHAFQGREAFDYWNIPIVLTNVASAVHETFRNNPRYQAMLLRTAQGIGEYIGKRMAPEAAPNQ